MNVGVALFVGNIVWYSGIKRYVMNLVQHRERPYMKRTTPDIRPECRQVEIPDLCDNPVELIWGASFALLIYQMGIAHAICTMNDHQTLLRKLRISGVSGGSATAGYMMATLHGIGDMKYWYSQHVRHIPEESAASYSVRNWATTIWNLGYEYYRICHILGMKEGDWTRRYRVIATHVADFTVKVLNVFPNAQSFADGIASSSFFTRIYQPVLMFPTI